MKFLIIVCIFVAAIIVYSFATADDLYLHIRVQGYKGRGAGIRTRNVSDNQRVLEAVIDSLTPTNLIFLKTIHLSAKRMLNEKIRCEDTIAKVTGRVGKLEKGRLKIDSLTVEVKKCLMRGEEEIYTPLFKVSGNPELYLDREYYLVSFSREDTVDILRIKVSQPKLKEYLVDGIKKLRFRKHRESAKDDVTEDTR